MPYGIEPIEFEGVTWWVVYRRWWIFKWSLEWWETADDAAIRLKQLCEDKP